MTIKALIFCQIEHAALKKVVEEFKAIPEIKKVFSLTGDFDLLAEIEVDTSEIFYEVFANKIDLIPGIVITNTHMVMSSWEK